MNITAVVESTWTVKEKSWLLRGHYVSVPAALREVCTGEADSTTAKALAAAIRRLPADDAQYSSCFALLGRMLARGDGVPRNQSAAVEWYSVAAKQGDARAQYGLGLLLLSGGSTSITGQFLHLIVSGSWIGRLLGYGVPMNTAAAFEWFTRAAKQGYFRAQYSLGVLLERGWGASKNTRTALEWHTRAAKQGYCRARNSVLNLLRAGVDGMDRSAAVEWVTEQGVLLTKVERADLTNNPELLQEALYDFHTTRLRKPEDLKHGDAVVGYFWLLQFWFVRLKLCEHWAIYDQRKNVFLELTGDTGDRQVKSAVVEREFEEWVDKWINKGPKEHPPQRVVWKDPDMLGKRAHAVEEARQRIHDPPHYALLPGTGGKLFSFGGVTMNCESFVRWCYTGIAHSTQAARFSGGANANVFARLIDMVVNYVLLISKLRAGDWDSVGRISRMIRESPEFWVMTIFFCTFSIVNSFSILRNCCRFIFLIFVLPVMVLL